MSYENKGTTSVNVIVTMHPDRSGNFIIESGADPATTIEAAWTYLATFGGGTLTTKGAGQTWTCQSTIDSQGSNVLWRSDLSLCITVNTERTIVSITHDTVTLKEVYVKGLRTSDTGIGLYVNGADDVELVNCKSEDAGDWGGIVMRNGCLRSRVVRCRVLDPYKHGIELGDVTDCWAEYCTVYQDITGADVASTGIVHYGSTRSGFYRCKVNSIRRDAAAIHGVIGSWIERCELYAGTNYGVVVGNEDVGGGYTDCIDAKVVDNDIYGSIDPDTSPTIGICISLTAAYDTTRLKIRGNSVDYFRHGIATVAAIPATAILDELEIRDNTTRRVRDVHIRVSGQSGTIIYRPVIEDNELHGQETHPESTWGMRLDYLDDASVKRNKLVDIGHGSGTARGISAIACPRAKIQNNDLIICDSCEIGIYIEDCNDSQIQNNGIFETPTGCQVQDGDNISFTDNRIIATTHGLDIAFANCDEIWVAGCNFADSANAVNDGGAATNPQYGNNADHTGNAVQDAEP